MFLNLSELDESPSQFSEGMVLLFSTGEIEISLSVSPSEAMLALSEGCFLYCNVVEGADVARGLEF